MLLDAGPEVPRVAPLPLGRPLGARWTRPFGRVRLSVVTPAAPPASTHGICSCPYYLIRLEPLSNCRLGLKLAAHSVPRLEEDLEPEARRVWQPDYGPATQALPSRETGVQFHPVHLVLFRCSHRHPSRRKRDHVRR